MKNGGCGAGPALMTMAEQKRLLVWPQELYGSLSLPPIHKIKILAVILSLTAMTIDPPASERHSLVVISSRSSCAIDRQSLEQSRSDSRPTQRRTGTLSMIYVLAPPTWQLYNFTLSLSPRRF